MTDHRRQPAGSTAGGQFAAATRDEVVVDLAPDAGPEPVDEPWPGPDFPRQWPSMIGAGRRRGTVRTTNGGEAHGLLSSYGTTYSIDVEMDDGRVLPLMSWRIAGVRLDEPVEPDEPAAARTEAQNQA